jgi:LppX_LprAFG lipoprotein
MKRSKARLGLGAAAASLAVVAVAGCSGSGSGGGTATGTGGTKSGSSAALSLVADAMNKANSAGTVKITGTITSPSSTTPITMTAEEQYSPQLAMSMTMQLNGQSLNEIMVGSKIYMSYPALASMMGGKKWGEIDLSQASGSLGSLSSLVDSAQSENPTTQISALVASGDVTKVGTDTVDGQQATHYSGTLTPSELANVANGGQLSASQISTLKSEMQSAGVSSEKVDLWVASSGLPVELKFAAKSSAGTSAGDMKLSDWGAPVSVGAPPASEVYDMTAALNGAEASASAAALANSSG